MSHKKTINLALMSILSTTHTQFSSQVHIYIQVHARTHTHTFTDRGSRVGNLPAFAGIPVFDGPQGHTRDSSKFRLKIFMSIRTLRARVADAVRSNCDHVCHFIPIQVVLSWLGGMPFANGLVSSTYVRFVEACKRDCGRRK